ncbi:DUF3488 and transglutaminase-like domain-containing protein [Naasia sp. SYSU D00948]|uniref:transglutaminase family protein n=1 Tax=Naasia sp. SYSU D00948 TaxID=2817379 RepID=UPI001B316D51|nr:DUF3488 and transglutaminase-like domain-containing protein [Naasia sp. SYSU D00948]
MSTSGPGIRRSTWGISAASLLAVLVAAGSLRTLIQGDTWWWASVLVGGFAVATAAGMRAIRPLRVLAPLGGSAVAVLLVPLIWVPESLMWGVIPTGRTVTALLELIRAAARQIYLDSPPATPTPGLHLMVAVGVALLAVLVDSLVAELRMPWLAGLPLLLLAIVPARAVGVGDDLAGVTVTVAAFLLLVWLDRRRDQSRPPASSAALLGAGAVVTALVVQSMVPTLVPPAPAAAGQLRPVFAPGADPLVRLGETLRRGADVAVLNYESSSSSPVYLRVVTIDDLTGDEWAPTTSDGDAASRQVRTFPEPEGLTDDVEREEATTIIRDAYQQRTWLPLPYPATSVAGLEGAWAWEGSALTVQAVGRTRPVDEYTVESLVVDPTVEQLRSAPAARTTDFARFLQLPFDMPDEIGDTARSVTAEAGTAYDQAVALQDYLRSPEFTYDENTPQRADGDGDSMDVLAAFLEEKRGYCTHFASAMTVMARELGIPSRIAVGYQPGERRLTEPGVYEVTSHDLHAWPELYFEGVGWTRFEPTPGRGDVPQYREGDAEASDTPSAAPTPTPTSSGAQNRPDQDVTAGATGAGGGPPIGGVALGTGAALVLLAPAGVRALIRRRRLGALGRERVGPAWDEVRDTALDLGLVPGGALTPRALADRLGAVIGGGTPEHQELAALLRTVERERYARPGSSSGAMDEAPVRRLLQRMRGSASRGARLRAALAPRSLLQGFEGVPRLARRVVGSAR